MALTVIHKDPTPHTLDALRRRLDREEAWFAKVIANVSPTHPGWPHLSDNDEYLLVFLSLGGKLNKVETERLSYYGYMDDPVGRLAALLSDW